NSYSYDQNWTYSITEAINKIFDEDSNVQLIVEFMDSKRHNNSLHYEELYRIYVRKYANVQFDAVITSDDNAVNFALKHRDKLFPGVPFIFCGVNNIALPKQENFKNITGALEVPGIRETLNIALKLHTGLKKVYLINESGTSGKSDRDLIESILGEFQGKLEAAWLEDFTEEALKQKLSTLGSDSFVILLSFFLKKKGAAFNISEGAEFVSNSTSRPVYSMWEYFLGKGILGGMLTSGTYQGKTAAQITRRVLDGENCNSIPVVSQTANHFMFDYKQMERFGIKPSDVPEKSEIINLPPSSLLRKYRLQLGAVGIVIAALVLFCVGLVVNIRARRKAEQGLTSAKQLLESMLEKQSVQLDQLKKAEVGLRESEEKHRILVEESSDPIFSMTSKGRYLFINRAFSKVIGKTAGDLIGKTFWDIFSEQEAEKRFSALNHCFNTGMTKTIEVCIPRLKEEYHYLTTFTPIKDIEGRVLSIICSAKDITELKRAEKEKIRLEAQLQQAMRLETIGTLAGGIAHDFNNILSPIIGHTEMLKENFPENIRFQAGLDAIYTAALRARDLVKQILTFSRQDTKESKMMKMQPVIEETLNLIRSTIPTTIDIKKDIQADCGIIKADPTHIHQIIMNLATNAYHAMEETGGELKVSLQEIEPGEQDVILGMKKGTCACLTVADTGIGMDKDLTGKIFEPFFTTKEQNKGTGMGLSVVHGIVKNAGGNIHVCSESGRGTEFHVYLPVIKNISKEQVIKSKAVARGRKEQILLVDDEESLVEIEKQMLEHLGYQVISFLSSIEALEAFRADPDKFDLVITDMAMPNMPGDKLAIELSKIRTDIPILLCTGYSEIMSDEKARSMGINGFLMKPFVMKEFSNKIRDMLDNTMNEK
ncbi:ATP-binding protein, partial [Desulfobacterales bacterium HSG17]|nr:ATP-binding protein [Desulfobacterales bacterium HSG17]